MKERVFESNYQAALGLKQGYAITAMPFGSLLDVQNMNIDAVGNKSTRRGYQKLFVLPVNEEVRSLFHFQPTSGDDLVLAYAHDTIYEWDGASVSSLMTSLTTDTPWQFAQFQDRVHGANGTNPTFTYDGTAYTNIGLTAPAHITLATAANPASTLDGIYSYVATFWDEDRAAESNPPDLDSAPTVNVGASGTNAARLGPFPAVASGETATHYRIYRKWVQNNAAVIQETIYTQVAELNYATYVGTTYDDVGLASGTIEVERDTGQQDEGNTPPPLSKLIVEFSNRLWMVDETNPTNLIYSRQQRPHAWPSANYFPIGDKDGARIIRIEKHGESLLIHKRNSVYILTDDPIDATPKRISGLGTQDYNTSQGDVDNYCYRLTPKGIYRFVPTEFDPTDLREEYIGFDIQDEEAVIEWSATSMVTMFNYKFGASQHVYMFFPAQADTSTKVLVYDRSIDQWVKYKLGTDVFSVAAWEDDGAQKMIFGDGYGYVWEWDSGEGDGHDLDIEEVNGTATAATGTTVSDTTQSWTVNEFAGLKVTIVEGTGIGQSRRIASNTSDTLTVTSAFLTTPDDTSVYAIGAIDSYADEFWNSHSYQNLWKRMRWIIPYIRQSGDFEVEVSFRRDFKSGYDALKRIQVSSSESSWGFLIWGEDDWGATSSTIDRVRFSGKYHYYTIRYQSKKASQRFFWDGHGVCFQTLYDRNK